METVTAELERLAGSVIVCGFAGTEVPQEVRSWIDQDTVAGLILFKRNLEDIDQASQLIASCHSANSGLPLLMCVDQEGGRVARFGPPVLELPPMRKLGAENDLALTTLAGRALGRQLRAIGINLDFAPVMDIDTNPDNPVIGDRAFGTTPDVVAAHAIAFAEGLHQGGVLSCGKHFPGHGDTDLDSHHALPRLRHDRARLDRVELEPFRQAMGSIASMMTAHVVYEELDQCPATVSRAMVEGLLRDDLGFDGPVFTDDLEMNAVSAEYAIEESGVLAIEAGCDLLLVCSDVDAAGRLRDALASKASSEPAFRQRLQAGADRANLLRDRIRTLPPPVSIKNALGHPEARLLVERLAQLD